MEIRRIGVLSAAKIVGALYLAIGLLYGLIFGCMALVGLAGVASVAGPEFEEFAGGGVGFLVFACFFPIMFGVIGAIAGAIGAAIYNLVAGWIGGLEIEFGERKP